jgi:predicted metal-dependent hydrolase
MVSTIDNREYLVQPKEDAQEAANLIAQIRAKVSLLIDHLIKSNYDNDSRIIMLKKNYNPNNFKEGVDDPEYTSYSINKGEKIVLCLRNKDKLVDINTLLFVVLHEVAHIATEEIGHTPDFWDNFRWILEESINIGIYTKQEFNKKPVEYCGMTITSSPLD